MADLPQLPGRAYRHRFEGPFYRRLLLGGVRYLPEPVQRLSMPLWGGLFYGLLPEARRTAERNLDQVLGPAPTLVRRLRCLHLFINYAQSLTDSYATHVGRRPLVPESEGRHRLLAALTRGRGVIATTGHLGLWQIGPFLASWRELPPFYMAMAEEPNPLVQAFEQRFRSRFRIVYTTGSPFSSLGLLQVLRQGAIVGMQMDRHVGGKAVALPFCGRPAWFSLGPATLARLSGAPLIPNFFVVEPNPWAPCRRALHIVEEPIHVPRTADREGDIRSATERLVAVYERFVRRYPLQWYHFHDFWEQPGRDTQATAARSGQEAGRSVGRSL
ncbi:MAG: lysophospholipid acyltransferase family protein [Myxococcales bacterium]|nr:lysophospholipid acyltransferase family protein [Myxococcota bacterium]MDW8281183.1 lysophospholipid acyltransferase family protein [Myxococcales bacterium]